MKQLTDKQSIKAATASHLTAEEKALGAFLGAMHDCKLDGAKMREAMLGVLGITGEAQPSAEPMQPTYYVRHPDDTYSVADPQPAADDRAGWEPVAYVLSETDIYDFAGWLTTRKEVIEVGSSKEAGPMAEAVGEYLRAYPDRFIAHPQHAQPAREWVGLDYKDWNDIAYSSDFREGAEWAESALREKNAGQPSADDKAAGRKIEQLIQQRDHRDDIINQLCDAVLGPDRQEWSSAYHFEDAVREVEERLAAEGKAGGEVALGILRRGEGGEFRVGANMDALMAIYAQPPGEHLLYTRPQPQADNNEATEPPPECQTEAEKRAFAFGWWKALEKATTPQAIAAEAKAKELDRCIRIIRAQMRRYKEAGKGVEAKAAERLSILIRRQDNAVRK